MRATAFERNFHALSLMPLNIYFRYLIKFGTIEL